MADPRRNPSSACTVASRSATVARIVANEHVLTDVGCQRHIQIAVAPKVDAVRVDAARFGHGQQQQIQLLG